MINCRKNKKKCQDTEQAYAQKPVSYIQVLTVFYALSFWQSDQNKREYNLNQSDVYPFVERVAKNNSGNNGDSHKISKILNCFVLVKILV